MNLQSGEQLEGGNLLGDPANMDLQGGGMNHEHRKSLYNRIETSKTLNINLSYDVYLSSSRHEEPLVVVSPGEGGDGALHKQSHRVKIIPTCQTQFCGSHWLAMAIFKLHNTTFSMIINFYICFWFYRNSEYLVHSGCDMWIVDAPS